MNEHIKKILDNKFVYYIHIAVYAVFTLLNIETILDPAVRDMGYPLSAAIVFTCLFFVMFVLESISRHSASKFLETNPVAFFYRVIQILLVTVFYFMIPMRIAAGACLVAVILFSVELLFHFQFDELVRRIFMYVIFAFVYEVVTVWQIFRCHAIYEGIDLIVSANVVIFSIVVICELIARTYTHFIKLLFAQSRTVENLNEANVQLKEQQEEIKKTNELLGMQKIELQAANKKINRSHDEMSVQNEISGAISSTMDMDELLTKVSNIMRVRLDMDFVCVVLEPEDTDIPGEEPDNRKVYISTMLGDRYAEQMENLILSGRADEFLALSNTYIQNTETSHTGLNYEAEEGKVLESIVIVPLRKHSGQVGNLIVAKKNLNAFMDNKAFYENIGSQLSIGIHNIRLYEQMTEMAIRDGLTRIYNRRHLTELLNGYLAEAMQKKTDVSLALFDIDKFKLVNDTYGHQCGDAVIRHVASLLNRAAVSNGGIAGRYGGEEFVIAFLGKSLDEVYEIVKEVHIRIKSEDVVYEDRVLNVCASAGIASYPETCKNPAELLTRADWAMYHSKRTGRDRITIDSEDLETNM